MEEEKDSPEEVLKKKFSPQVAAVLAILGGAPAYVMSEYFYTRREAQIEIQHIREDAAQIKHDQEKMKVELLEAARVTNQKLDRMIMKMTIYLRAQKEPKDGKLSVLRVDEEDNEGG